MSFNFLNEDVVLTLFKSNRNYRGFLVRETDEYYYLKDASKISPV